MNGWAIFFHPLGWGKASFRGVSEWFLMWDSLGVNRELAGWG
jgi:hypothetical protein